MSLEARLIYNYAKYVIGGKIENWEHSDMICGRILRIALNTELTIEDFIAYYSCFPNINRYFLLLDKLTDMKFGSKIKKFKEICKREGVDKKEVDAVVANADFIRERRNDVAHDERLIIYGSTEPVKLVDRKWRKGTWNELELTNDLVAELDKRNLEITGATIRILNKLLEERLSKEIAATGKSKEYIVSYFRQQRTKMALKRITANLSQSKSNVF